MHHSSFLLTLICFSDILGRFITLGDQYSLECLSNYLSNITCSLDISAEFLGNESSYWLHFSTDDEEDHNCTLKRRTQSLLCELDLSPWRDVFHDMDSYTISLRSGYHGNNFSIVLHDFMPKEHIRPVPPSNLSILWEKDGALFQWQSGYDEDNLLSPHLQYEFSMHSEDKQYEVKVSDLKMYMDKTKFEPHSNYTVRVRSEPDQEFYKGVWSPWTPALHWRSGDIHKETLERSFHIVQYFLLSPLLLVLLVGIAYSRWRKHEYIPSPAPYFRDWDVDVQMSSMLSSKVRDVMQGEESLQIDILTENTDPRLTMLYEMSDQDDLTPQSPSMPHSPVWSEVDSGCWVRDFVAPERGSITCSEDYCTLSNSHTYDI